MLNLLIFSLALNAVLIITALILTTRRIYYSEYIQRKIKPKGFSRETQVFLNKLNREQKAKEQS